MTEVICQLRFPTILKITSEEPAAFQDLIRQEYPLFEMSPPEPPLGLPPELADMMRERRSSYAFATEDRGYKVTLGRDFLALSCTKYTDWQRFEKQLEAPLKALLGIYHPAFFTRVGLRYKNLLQLSKLGLEGREWCELLIGPIAGELGSPDIKADVDGRSAVTELLIEPDTRVLMQHGTYKEGQSGQSDYIIDSDFFTTTNTSTEDVYARLQGFNRLSGRLFRWCITPILQDAMEPGGGPADEGDHRPGGST